MAENFLQAFDQIAGEYQQKALLQNKAAGKLLGLLKLQGREDVLDLGCGPGHITDAIRALTKGRVVGADISNGMIAEACASYPKLEFWQSAAEELEGTEIFDAVFCNSAFQWFPDPAKALQAMHRLLRPGGRLGLACPMAWPTFESAVLAVASEPEIAAVFAHWKNPWLLLPGLHDYQILMECAGFVTLQAEAVEEVTVTGVEQAYQYYLSGASNGYTGRAYYDIPVTDEYITAFNRLVRREIAAVAREGKVEIKFRRLFYLGQKTGEKEIKP